MVPEETEQPLGVDYEGEESLNRLRRYSRELSSHSRTGWAVATGSLHGMHVRWVHAERPGLSLTCKTALGHGQGGWQEVKGTLL